MKQLSLTDKEHILICALVINKIDKMEKTILKYGNEDMVENVDEYKRLLEHIEV